MARDGVAGTPCAPHSGASTGLPMFSRCSPDALPALSRCSPCFQAEFTCAGRALEAALEWMLLTELLNCF